MSIDYFREDLQVQTKTTPVKQNSEKAETSRKTYKRPVLTTYGLVKSLTQGALSAGSDGGSGFNQVMSDRILKENIVRVGDHPLGIGLYLFDYKPEYQERCGYGRQFGAMADEVEIVMPEAVCVHPDGYKMVNYPKLGISYRIQ